MKVWEKRFPSRQEKPFLEDFNASIQQDRFLWEEEIEASLAYASTLAKAGVLSSLEMAQVSRGLKQVKKRIHNGEDLRRFEDIHSAVEILLTEEIGKTGQKLHTGRSRNEQVVTDERLYLKKKIPEIVKQLEEIQTSLIHLTEENFHSVLPGYTHLQQGQFVLFSHYVMSLFWQLERGKERLRENVKRVSTLPLGSGALAGSTVSLDREYLKSLLGFEIISENSMDIVTDRSFILETLFALALILLDISRFSEDLIIYSSHEFRYIRLGDDIVTSSSLMPQKRNPDLLELIRTGPAKLYGHFSQLFITIKGLPSTYNKDLQNDKLPLHRGIEETMEILQVFQEVVSQIEINPLQITRNVDPGIYATDLVDYLVYRKISFREAHGIVGQVVAYAEKTGRHLNTLSLDEFHQFSPLFGKDVFGLFDPMRSIKQKKTEGSTHPTYVKKQLEKAKDLVGFIPIRSKCKRVMKEKSGDFQ